MFVSSMLGKNVEIKHASPFLKLGEKQKRRGT